MLEFLKYICSLIVDHPQDIQIEENSFADNVYQYILKVNDQDTGQIIGKEGKIIQAIRNIAKILAIKEEKQIRIEIAPS